MSDQRQPTANPRVILVDDEEALVWSLSNRLMKARPTYTVETANDGYRALSLLRAAPTSLLITDISMEGMQGTELIMMARRRFPELPVIVITAYPTADLLQKLSQGSIEYLEKPFEFDALLRCVDEVLERNQVGFSGAISLQTLPDIVQLYALSGTTGALQIRHGGSEGVIWYNRGAIVHATLGSASGADAFHQIMFWSGGEFTMKAGELAPKRSITMGWAELLMESCRLIDERKHQTGGAGGPLSVRGWNRTDTSELDAVAPEEPDATTPGGDHLIVDVILGDDRVSSEDKKMDYKHSVSKLGDIDGFIGAAIVDAESGMLLAQEGGGPINLEVAGASNTEVVKAKRKAMRNLNVKDDIEDLLITLGKQYHLIRPLKSKPSLFFYLVLDRQRSNLAMARISLADVDKELV